MNAREFEEMHLAVVNRYGCPQTAMNEKRPIGRGEAKEPWWEHCGFNQERNNMDTAKKTMKETLFIRTRLRSKRIQRPKSQNPLRKSHSKNRRSKIG